MKTLTTLILLASFIACPARDLLPNLLTKADLSSNLESYNKGLRGGLDHMIFDTLKDAFAVQSVWHEFGVDFNGDLGVVAEQAPAWWQAQWKSPVRANYISLTGVHPNQPQPDTAWKIELRRKGSWITHAKGVGGWCNAGNYTWGGREMAPVEFDAIRVSVFSKDDHTPIKSIHFRGERRVSWVVAHLPPIDARIRISEKTVRAGEAMRFSGEQILGEIRSWRWSFGDGVSSNERVATHTFSKPGLHQVRLSISDGGNRLGKEQLVNVLSPVEVAIVPLTRPVMVGKPVEFVCKSLRGDVMNYNWNFGDGSQGDGMRATHVFTKPGIYKVRLSASNGTYGDDSLALVRAHTPATLGLPQIVLDTDAKNEVDDQHYISYGLFSGLDILGINSIHHGGGQESINHGEILKILDLAGQSGLPDSRKPFVFRGADERLKVPESGVWSDTAPVITEASNAILAAARGASPEHPVWVLPVGPGSNVASAILQARDEGLNITDRIKVIWLGGGPERVNSASFNGGNDPWSIHVIGESGVELWIILENPTDASITMDKRVESNFYPDTPLGDYLETITPDRKKALYDVTTISMVVGNHLGEKWLTLVEPSIVLGPDDDYRWKKSSESTRVFIIRDIDEEAMKKDFFNTLNGAPSVTALGTAGSPALENDRALSSTPERVDESSPANELATDRASDATRKFVRAWTIKDLRSDLNRIGEGRSFTRGRDLFKAVVCDQCHVMNQMGGTLGPDLTGVAGRNSRAAILREIIEPSKQIPEEYQSTMIVTTGGATHLGFVVRQNAGSISLANDPAKPDQLLEIPLEDIRERTKSTLSMMPEGLLNTLTRDEILDLLAYIESRGQEDHPVFDTDK